MVSKLAGMVDKKITLGNIATMVVFIVSWGISGAIWYSQVQSHVEATEIHRTAQQTQEETDKRIHLLTDSDNAETQRRLSNIERLQEETLRVLYEVKGKQDKGR